METAHPTGPLEIALAHGHRLLADAPALAVQQAQEILRAMPDQRDALLLLARAQRATGDAAAARAVLERLTTQRPADAEAWQRLGDLLGAQGDLAGADQAYLRGVEAGIDTETSAWPAS